MADAFDLGDDGAVEVDDIAAAALEFDAFFESVEKGADAHDEYDHRDAVSDAAVFDELEGGVFKDAAGKPGEILEVAVLVGIEIGDEPRDEDTAEQRQEDTEDLR